MGSGMIWTSHYQIKDGGVLPEGTNRLYLDGSCSWIGNDRMGDGDTPLTIENEVWMGLRRYSHYPPADGTASSRDYYW